MRHAGHASRHEDNSRLPPGVYGPMQHGKKMQYKAGGRSKDPARQARKLYDWKWFDTLEEAHQHAEETGFCPAEWVADV